MDVSGKVISLIPPLLFQNLLSVLTDFFSLLNFLLSPFSFLDSFLPLPPLSPPPPPPQEEKRIVSLSN